MKLQFHKGISSLYRCYLNMQDNGKIWELFGAIDLIQMLAFLLVEKGKSAGLSNTSKSNIVGFLFLVLLYI